MASAAVVVQVLHMMDDLVCGALQCSTEKIILVLAWIMGSCRCSSYILGNLHGSVICSGGVHCTVLARTMMIGMPIVQHFERAPLLY